MEIDRFYPVIGSVFCNARVRARRRSAAGQVVRMCIRASKSRVPGFLGRERENVNLRQNFLRMRFKFFSLRLKQSVE